MRAATARAVRNKVSKETQRKKPERGIVQIGGYTSSTQSSIYVRTEKYNLTFTCPVEVFEKMKFEEYEALVRSFV